MMYTVATAPDDFASKVPKIPTAAAGPMKTSPKKMSWPSEMLRRSVPVDGADRCSSMGPLFTTPGMARTETPGQLVA